MCDVKSFITPEGGEMSEEVPSVLYVKMKILTFTEDESYISDR